jgi:hypothetical protein
MSHNLPPELQAFAALLDAQPGPVQMVFQYCLAMLMVEAGKAELVRTEPGEAGAVCMFRTLAGDVFSLARPPLSKAEEARMKEMLREILGHYQHPCADIR